MRATERKREDKACARRVGIVLRMQLASVLLHQGAGQVKADTRAALIHGLSAGRLVEAPENILKVFRSYSYTIIYH